TTRTVYPSCMVSFIADEILSTGGTVIGRTETIPHSDKDAAHAIGNSRVLGKVLQRATDQAKVSADIVEAAKHNPEWVFWLTKGHCLILSSLARRCAAEISTPFARRVL